MKEKIRELVSWFYLIYSWLPLMIVNVYLVLGVRDFDSVISNFIPINIFFNLFDKINISYIIIAFALMLIILYALKFKRKLILSFTLLFYTIELFWFFIYNNTNENPYPFVFYKDFLIVYIIGLTLYVLSTVKWNKYVLIGVTSLFILSVVIKIYLKPHCPIEELYKFQLSYGKSSSDINPGTFAIDTDGRWYHLDASGGHRGSPLDTKHYNEDLSEELIEFFGLEDKIKLG